MSVAVVFQMEGSGVFIVVVDVVVDSGDKLLGAASLPRLRRVNAIRAHPLRGQGQGNG
jgi:hypothetical protein